MAYMKDADGVRLDTVSVGQAVTDASQALLLVQGVAATGTAQPLSSEMTFTKVGPLFDTTDTGADFPTIYWPWVLRVDTLLDTPLGNFYMWFSTDHGQGNGCIGLAYADDLAGPWTQVGKVYQYNEEPGGSGTETETPSVVWDAANSRFIMYHQQVGPTGAVASQVTMAATSPDGVTWTAYGIVADLPVANQYPAPGHTGYFRPRRDGDSYAAYSLLAGETYSSRCAIWHSKDGLHWELDPYPLSWGQEHFDASENKQVVWHSSTPILWRGRDVLVCTVGAYVSGPTVDPAVLCIAPLAGDQRKVTNRPVQVMESGTEPWETDDIANPQVFVDDGRLWCVYRDGDGTVGHPFTFGLAYAEAVS